MKSKTTAAVCDSKSACNCMCFSVCVCVCAHVSTCRCMCVRVHVCVCRSEVSLGCHFQMPLLWVLRQGFSLSLSIQLGWLPMDLKDTPVSALLAQRLEAEAITSNLQPFYLFTYTCVCV